MKILRSSPTSPGNSRSSLRIPMGRASTRIVGNPILLSSRAKITGRRMLEMVVNTLFLQDQSALGVKASIT